MFHSARLKLTVWYLFGMMMLSITFSTAVYQILTAEIDRLELLQRSRMEYRINQSCTPQNNFCRLSLYLPVNTELLTEARSRIISHLTLINLAVFILSAGMGYILAGRTLAPIAEMMEEQNRFISDASHELKTPLTSLKSAFEVYLRDNKRTKKEADALAAESIEEVNKLTLLSDSLLTLAQYQRPNGHHPKEKISIETLIDAAVRKVRPLAVKKNIEIQKKVTDFKIATHKDALIDVLVIFLDNAIKYSWEATTVEIRAEKKATQVHISIVDFGIGIAKSDVPHIFDRFYRSDVARTKSHSGGYGLGLSIAKKIIEDLNGSISVKSKIKEGTTFTIKLPLK